MAIRYHIALPDPGKARGSDPALSFRSHGADGLAADLQDALRGNTLFNRWRGQQDDLVAVSSIPGAVLRHRLRLLAGNGWELRDVSNA